MCRNACGPIHVNLNKTVFYVSEVNIFCRLSPSCMFMAYQYTSGHYLPVDLPFYYVIPFTMCAVVVQMPRIDTFCMSEAVMQLVAGTLCYENVVMHIMRMVFHSNVESYKLYIYNRLPFLQISMFRSSSQDLVAASGQRRPAKPSGALYNYYLAVNDHMLH